MQQPHTYGVQWLVFTVAASSSAHSFVSLCLFPTLTLFHTTHSICRTHSFSHQVAELATQMYITNDKPNVSGLVLSGSADFKTELSLSDLFDPRLQAVVLGVVDVSYGERGEVGVPSARGRGNASVSF